MAKRILISTDVLGRANEELGRILMRSFLVSLAHEEHAPAAVMFINEGVRLACEGSEALDELRMLAGKGVAISACGTCLNHLGLTESLVVGEAGTMPDLVAAICGADRIATIG
jgi:selenium metabolism protein YedF